MPHGCNRYALALYAAAVMVAERVGSAYFLAFLVTFLFATFFFAGAFFLAATFFFAGAFFLAAAFFFAGAFFLAAAFFFAGAFFLAATFFFATFFLAGAFFLAAAFFFAGAFFLAAAFFFAGAFFLAAAFFFAGAFFFTALRTILDASFLISGYPEPKSNVSHKLPCRLSNTGTIILNGSVNYRIIYDMEWFALDSFSHKYQDNVKN